MNCLTIDKIVKQFILDDPEMDITDTLMDINGTGTDPLMDINGSKYNTVVLGGYHSKIRASKDVSVSSTYNGITPSILSNEIPEDDDDTESVNNYICKYVDEEWNFTAKWDQCKSDKFPELQKHHDEIMHYYLSTLAMREKLILGKTVIVGIISKPGMGKSTLIRMLATTLNTDIYIAPDEELERGVWENVNGIVIVEDYDRYNFNIEAPNEVSTIPLMIYTSNSYLKNANELDILIKFEDHTLDTYRRSVNIVFPEGREDIAQLLFDSKISMRETNILLINSMLTSDQINYIIENVGKITLTSSALRDIEDEEFDDDDWF